MQYKLVVTFKTCKICGNSTNNRIYRISEKTFDLGENFDYIDCSICGTLQIKEIPNNISDYYPKNYYSFNSNGIIPKNSLILSLFKTLSKYRVFRRGFLGKILYKLTPYTSPLDFLSYLDLNLDSHILDVGCGSGDYLKILKLIGFNNLQGLDLYYDQKSSTNLAIYKKSILELDDSIKFDLIMFHHSFEHEPDPSKVILKIKHLLRKNGSVLFRIPVKNQLIWEKYGINWYQIDAPRHFFIYEVEGFLNLLKSFGLNLKQIIFDSDERQFWISEQYKSGISLYSKNSYAVNPRKSIFSRNQIKKFKTLSKKMNKTQQGDQCGFIFSI